MGIPATKKRGILREFLQTQILYYLYTMKESRHLIFTGGTALRFSYDNKRLSEDLDFDLSQEDLPLKHMLKRVIDKQTSKEKTIIDFKFKKQSHGAHAYFKYKTILFELGISQLKEENLTIKFDFSYPEDKIQPIDAVFSKFGYFQTVLTYDQSTLLSFKTRALYTRKTERGRDLYDIAKLISHHFKPNFNIRFFKKKHMRTVEDYWSFLRSWHQKNSHLLPQLKKQLLPFLINEEEIIYIDLLFKNKPYFPTVVR